MGVREVLTRTIMRAEWLFQVDQPTLKAFLQAVKDPGDCSDQQLSLVKALKATWHKQPRRGSTVNCVNGRKQGKNTRKSGH
jgi:hypothetical protein